MYAQARPGLIPVPSFAGLYPRPVVHEIRSVACWAKKKGTRIIVTLECTEARAEGKPPSRYTTQKNKRNTPDRLELMKYNRFLRRHTLHKEIK